MSSRLLFIPVSSSKGIGEYMRSLTIAQTIKEHQDIDIRFILSQQALYHESCPFPTFLCPASPTKHTVLVNRYVDEFKPNVVIFDASGRAEQLKYCKKAGAHTIFICQHNKKLQKGLSIRRLPYTDQIWIVQPQFALSPLSSWSHFKLKLLNKPLPTAIGPIFQTPDATVVSDILSHYQLGKGQYVLVNAGSGGHRPGGKNATEVFAQAAHMLSQRLHEKVVVVYGPNFSGEYLDKTNCLIIPRLEAAHFNALLSQAHGAILAGGSALLQAISYGLNIVSCAVSKDQNERIDACVKQELLKKSELDADELSATALTAFTTKKVAKTPLFSNGLAKAKAELLELLEK